VQSDGKVVEAKYSVIRTRDELDKLIRRLFEVDEWSFHLNDSNSNEKSSCYEKQSPKGVAIGIGEGEAFYVDLDDFEAGRDKAVRPLKDIFTNPYMHKSAHDAKRAAGALLKLGIK